MLHKAAKVIQVKVCSIQYPERYVVRRMVMAAYHELSQEFPGLEIEVNEVKDSGEIGCYAHVLVLPTLVINEKVVCSGRFPVKEEVKAWLREAILAEQDQSASPATDVFSKK
ncbi:MAG: thioredoxin family protein [Anaerolineales bacterium]|nr:thioredoxin family protein [Anaerolineales bacterium]MCX7609521.1 thioredoxin family protein [Anaerolineales bacterium]MDW8226182.1 thioredoxin family protein [Anaerolineales bacterium]